MRTRLNKDTFALYLKKLGWKRVASNRESIDIYIEPNNNDPIEILLPNRDISNSDIIIDSALKVLSSYYDKNVNYISRAISGIDKDFHNFRIDDSESNSGVENSVPIPLLHSLVSANRYMLLRAYRLHAKLDYDKLTAKEKKQRKPLKDIVQSYLNQCRFLHTWHGSFGITIENPLQIPSIGLLDADKIPDSLGRKTTKTVIKGLSIINAAVEKQSINYIFDQLGDSKEELLILSQFAELQESIEKLKIEYSVTASPIIDFKIGSNFSNKITIDRKSINYIEEAVDKISYSNVIRKINFVGFPEAFRSPMQGLLPESELKEVRKVTVKGISRETGSASLTMPLSISDYLKAIKAQESLKNVSVVCDVRQQKRGWEVLNVYSFNHIQEDSTDDFGKLDTSWDIPPKLLE